MIVLDASAAVHIVRGTEEGHALRALMLEGERTLAPDLFRTEVCSAFWKYCQAGLLDTRTASRFITAAFDVVDDYVSSGNLWPEVLSEAVRLGHSVYDMEYFVLARRNGATLFTLDRPLQKLCADHGVNVVEMQSL